MERAPARLRGRARKRVSSGRIGTAGSALRRCSLIRRTRRSSLWPLVVALGALAQPSHAQAPANAVPVKTYTGFFNNSAVYFLAFETNSSNFASVNGLVYAPRLSSANSAGVDNMIFFNNGAAGQTVVLQSEPGLPDYSPIHHVLT